VAHTCNWSYSGGRDQEIPSSKPAWVNGCETLSWKHLSQNKAGGMALGVSPEFKLQYCKNNDNHNENPNKIKRACLEPQVTWPSLCTALRLIKMVQMVQKRYKLSYLYFHLISAETSLYIYIYIYTCVCMCVYIYIYIYIYIWSIVCKIKKSPIPIFCFSLNSVTDVFFKTFILWINNRNLKITITEGGSKMVVRAGNQKS
jgi:hypothetical protein